MKMQWMLSVVVLLFSQPTWAQDDVDGSSDHPLIGRLEGSFIHKFDQKDFDTYNFAMNPVLEERLKVEGRTTRIAYTMPSSVSVAGATQALREGLEAKGFEVVFACETKECGGRDFVYGLDVFAIPHMSIDGFDYRYIAARKVVEGADVYVTVAHSMHPGDRVKAQVTVVEAEALKLRLVDAAEMKRSISITGSVAIHGIFFDTDKADVKTESTPAIEQMASFLGNSDLDVIIVGHTDNQGNMEYNLTLSHQRAEAVKQVLVGEFGIAASRLTAAGAGFLAPVAPNDSFAGRAQNRRVEMIPR